MRTIPTIAFLFLIAVFHPVLAQDTWKPSDALKASVETHTALFWDTVDSGEIAAAYSLFDPSFQVQVPYDRFEQIMREAAARGGGVLMRQTTSITWYRRPGPDGEITSYAAADFQGSTELATVYCGYVIWHVPDEGAPRLIRVEQNHLPDDLAAKLPAGEIARIKAAWRCP